MRFTDIRIEPAEANSPDPRASPSTVPDRLIVLTPPTLTGTDEAPAYMVLGLEAADGETVDVTAWAKVELPLSIGQFEDQADRRFQKIAAVTVTEGELVSLPAMPGPVYLQLANAPTLVSTLRVGWAATAIPVPAP